MLSPKQRREKQIDDACKREVLQAKCHHFKCHPVAWDWQGRPTEVTCDHCGAMNYIEHPCG